MKKRISLVKTNDAVLKSCISNIKKNIAQDKRIGKKYVTIMKQYEKEKKSRKIFNNKAENKYSFITKVDDDDSIYLGNNKCFALNGNYKRCKKLATYLYNGIKNENTERKCNVSLCTRHTNLILSSKNKKTLKFGFYFESDKYT